MMQLLLFRERGILLFLYGVYNLLLLVRCVTLSKFLNFPELQLFYLPLGTITPTLEGSYNVKVPDTHVVCPLPHSVPPRVLTTSLLSYSVLLSKSKTNSTWKEIKSIGILFFLC